jgi:molybdate transport system ATP-binding protein
MTNVRVAKKADGVSLDIDFAIAAGVTAFYGPACAGKTLLLKMIAGLVMPDSGRILLEDAILYDREAGVSVPPRRRGIGYVSPRDALFPHMTLERNLAFAAHAWPRLERHRRVSEMLEKVELTAAAALRPAAASPQQRLRCAVGRALIAEPRLLLLDHAGLDEALLTRVRTEFKSRIVLATGDLDLCSAAADQLILLEAGRIVQSGNPRAVLDGPDSVEAARLLGIPNIFEGSIAALDPGRGSSRLEFSGFTLSGPYIPGHFRGDRISIAVRPEALRVHAGQITAADNFVTARLVSASERTRYVRLEFDRGIFADVRHDEYARQKENQDWQVEFPAESLRIL